VVSGTFQELGSGFEAIAPFANPLAILDGAREWFYGGGVAGSPVSDAGVPLFLYGVAAAVLLGVSWLVLAVRYRGIAT
jgi:hypothetical protein